MQEFRNEVKNEIQEFRKETNTWLDGVEGRLEKLEVGQEKLEAGQEKLEIGEKTGKRVKRNKGSN